MTRESFTHDVLKIRDLFWSRTFTKETAEEIRRITLKIADEIKEITGSDDDGYRQLACGVIMNTMDNEAARRRFFEEYEIPYESAEICLQM